MWWEILPSAAIVYALLIAPHGVHWVENRIRTGRVCLTIQRMGLILLLDIDFKQ